MNAKEILAAALRLDPEERSRLIEELNASLPSDFGDGDVEQAWLVELDRRSAELDAGTAELVEWSDIRQRIAQRRTRRAG